MHETFSNTQEQAARREDGIARLVERVCSGEMRALARAISLVENDSPLAQEVLSRCFPFTGRALRVGLTGAPGAGKSTLVDRLARYYRSQQTTVGVVAVDPTSSFTGGAILGDRVRMKEDLSDAGLFVRSMATRGALGGLARTTADVASVIDASGKDLILIETVGVGQDEIDIVRLADVTLVVLVPGMGDDVQSLKAGILEIADIFVLNKSDREGADRLEREVRTMQALASEHGSWIPPVVRTVATTGGGTAELAAAIEQAQRWLGSESRLQIRRRASWRRRIVEMMRQELLRELQQHGLTDAELDGYAERVVSKSEDPYELAPRLVREAIRGSGERKPEGRPAAKEQHDED
jgi:LAO/AO transport system kinase